MSYDALKETEKGVLKTYQKANPSTHLIDENEGILKEHKRFRETLFRDRLKFPLKMFNGAKILDLGSGTGEQCIFYAKWGAKLTCVEMNKLAVERFNKLFSQFKLEDSVEQIHNISLFDFNPGDKKYDIVISDGVLHHTEKPELGFQKLVSNLVPGGFAILGIGNSAGGFQRNLQRIILFRLSRNEEELTKLASDFFPEHLARAAKFGNRTKKAIIYDTYINPKIHWISTEEVLTWFSKNSLKFYSSWPPLQLPFPLVDSPNREALDLEKEMKKFVGGFSELFWMTANESDSEVISKNENLMSQASINLKNISSYVGNITPESANSMDIKELTKLMESLDNNAHIDILKSEFSKILLFKSEALDLLRSLDKDSETLKKKINSYKILFKGSCGLGMSYFAGYRPL